MVAIRAGVRHDALELEADAERGKLQRAVDEADQQVGAGDTVSHEIREI